MSVTKLEHLYEEVLRCNRCGFCLTSCPIYDMTGKEASVARGHHAHIRGVIEGRLEFGEALKLPFNQCLLCKACTINCFAKVDIEKVMIGARAELAQRYGLPLYKKVAFDKVLPHAGLTRTAARLGFWARRSLPFKLLESTGIMGAVSKSLGRALELVQNPPQEFLIDRIAAGRAQVVAFGRNGIAGTPGSSETHPEVAYFAGCGMNYLVPGAAEDTIATMNMLGYTPVLVENNCCGLPAYGSGDLESARKMAKRNIELFESAGAKHIVTDCSSCSSFLKEYPILFESDPAMLERARRFSAKILDYTEFLNRIDLPALKLPGRRRITFHDPCHACRYQDLREPNRRVLAAIGNAEFKEHVESDRCCGMSGTFSITYPDQSSHVLDRKMNNIGRTEAEWVVTTCPGCMVQLAYGLRSHRMPGEVKHLSHVVRLALEEGS